MRCRKLKLSRIFLLVICLCCLQIGYSQTNSAHNPIALSKYLEHLHKTKAFSGEILIARGSEVLFNEAIGKANHELDVDTKVGNKYHIASITKTFTGTLMTMAISEGRLDKNDKLDAHLKNIPEKFSGITIHQLLTHTSGMPHNEAISDYWQKKSRLDYTSKQMLEELARLELLHAPGEKFSYSSPGYYLLSLVLEVVYGKPYHDVLKEKILNPLDLQHTGSANTLEILSDMSNGYHLLPNGSLVRAPYRNYSMVKGAGDLYSTVQDLWNWHRSFASEQLLSKKSQTEIFDKKKLYGNGWYIDRSDHLKYYHGGGTWGFSSYNAYYPEKALSIIVLSNVSKLPMTTIGEQLESLVFGDSSFKIQTIEEKPSELSDEQYAGVYESETSKMTLSILSKDEELYAQMQGNPPFKLTPVGGNKYYGKQIDIALNFQVNNNQVIGLEAERMGRKFGFKKQ